MVDDEGICGTTSRTLNAMFARCTSILEDPNAFSKVKSFVLLIAMKIVDYKDTSSDRFRFITEQALIFVNADNLFSRNLGKAILFKCMKAVKSAHKTRITHNVVDDAYLLNQNKTVDQIIEFDLYRPEHIAQGFTTNRQQDYLIYSKSTK